MAKPEKYQSGYYKSSGPFRISVYIYPNQLRDIQKISKKTGKSKRHIFFEMIHLYIQDAKSMGDL